MCSLLVQQYSLILFLCLTPTEWPLTGNTYCLLNMCPAYALHLTNMLTSYSYLRHALLLLSTLVMYELVRWNTMTQIAPLAHDRVGVHTWVWPERRYTHELQIPLCCRNEAGEESASRQGAWQTGQRTVPDVRDFKVCSAPQEDIDIITYEDVRVLGTSHKFKNSRRYCTPVETEASVLKEGTQTEKKHCKCACVSVCVSVRENWHWRKAL